MKSISNLIYLYLEYLGEQPGENDGNERNEDDFTEQDAPLNILTNTTTQIPERTAQTIDELIANGKKNLRRNILLLVLPSFSIYREYRCNFTYNRGQSDSRNSKLCPTNYK